MWKERDNPVWRRLSKQNKTWATSENNKDFNYTITQQDGGSREHMLESLVRGGLSPILVESAG